MKKDIIGILLFKKSFHEKETRNNFLNKTGFKTNFRKKEPIIKNNYYLYKQKDFIKYERIDEKVLNNGVKYLIGYKN